MDNCMAPGRDHASKALRYGTRSQGISQCLSRTEEFLALFSVGQMKPIVIGLSLSFVKNY